MCNRSRPLFYLCDSLHQEVVFKTQFTINNSGQSYVIYKERKLYDTNPSRVSYVTMMHLVITGGTR